MESHMNMNGDINKCPYSSQLKNMNKNELEKLMQNMNQREQEDTISTLMTNNNSTLDTEKGITIEMNNLPSGNNPKCPYKEDHTIKIDKENNPEIKKDLPKESKEEEYNSDEEANQGGCPVMGGRMKKDPLNKHYEAHYEIPRFGPFDFMFIMKGGLEYDEFLEKSKRVRELPRHLKYTIFIQNQEKLQKVHELEFPRVFFAYDDLKEKANRLFRRKKFREAVDHYCYAYGLLKWVEFKDKKRQENFLKHPSLDPILDEDIVEKQVYMDDVKVEEDSFKACVVYILNNLSYAYMELRHYSEAVDCLDESLIIAEDKVPDLYFRRSQSRTYNKHSTNKDLELAMLDIEKSITLKNEEMYLQHKNILIKIIDERALKQIQMTERVLEKSKKSYNRIKDKKIDIENVIYTKKNKDAITQYKIIKEMRSKYNLAIKFFTESKNEEQLEISYKEIDNFMETFEEFKFFFKFTTDDIPIQVMDGLSEEEKYFYNILIYFIIYRRMLDDDTHVKLIDEFKFKICEDIFGNGNFNFELFQYALEKIFEEDRKIEEEEELRLEASKPKLTWLESISKSSFVKYLSGGIIFLSIGSIGVHYYLYSSSSLGSFFK